jgi:hypothetical protein
VRTIQLTSKQREVLQEIVSRTNGAPFLCSELWPSGSRGNKARTVQRLEVLGVLEWCLSAAAGCRVGRRLTEAGKELARDLGMAP